MVRRFVQLGSLLLVAGSVAATASAAPAPWVVFPGGEGPGKGKNVVFVSGDEEYRSEEGLPQLARILAKHHGFTCTVLFAVGDDGTIDPNRSFIPGLEALRKADLMVILTRFRDLPDDQMKEIADYVESGRPIVGLRTATHAFNLKAKSPYAKYSWNNKDKEYEGGFGRQVLGETWISHHGDHRKQATRGILAPDAKDSPILKGIKDGDIFGPTDVYGVRLPLPGDSKPVVMGQVVENMEVDGKPLPGKKNDPMMPIAWTKSYTGTSGKSARIFTTTMGSSTDIANEGVRRLVVNACYWALGMEDQIPASSNVAIVGKYEPHPYGNNGFTKGVTPESLGKD